MKVLQILVLIFGLIVTLNAQKAILSGTIYDPNGAVIPGTKITAINEKGEKFESETNVDGIYVLNLPFNSYNVNTPANFRIAKYEIIVLRNSGFEKLILKDFKFVPSFKGKMNLDIALDIDLDARTNHEPCGYSGGDCITTPLIDIEKTELSEKISNRPLEKLPEVQNKTKRKNKIINNE